MINVLLSGCNGQMGQVITKLAQTFAGLTIVAGVDVNQEVSSCYPVFSSLDEAAGEISFDVIIDFSHPSAFEGMMRYCSQHKTPVVMATTGYSQEQKEKMQQYALQFPLFHSANMSLGINLIIELAKKAAKLLEGNFDIEIVERHHNRKVDAPSGTALAIADEINGVLQEKCEYAFDRTGIREKRRKHEIGMHAVRGGTIVGEHTVIFAGNDELIEITHAAHSREIFGIGALKAAVFMYGKAPGFYQMGDLLG